MRVYIIRRHHVLLWIIMLGGKKTNKKYLYFEAHHCSLFSVAYTLNTTSSMYSVLWISAIFGWNNSAMHIYLSCQPCSLSRMSACSIQYLSGTVSHGGSVISQSHLTSWRTNTGMVLLFTIFYFFLVYDFLRLKDLKLTGPSTARARLSSAQLGGGL